MAEYIEREAVLAKQYNASNFVNPMLAEMVVDVRDIEDIPAADVVEVETVAKMLCQALGDECPCNFCPIDEWLPEVCELQDECPNPKDKWGCWKQYIKHWRAE